MSDAKKSKRSLEGYYDYYGTPAYILKQRNGAYASGFYDAIDGIFKAGGSAKKILWDGVRLSEREARKFIQDYSLMIPVFENDGKTPEWILLPDEAAFFLKQSDEDHDESKPGNEDLPGEKNSV